MLNTPFPIRVYSTLSSAILEMLLNDPQDLLYKAMERIRLANFPFISHRFNSTKLAKPSKSPHRTLFHEGHLEESANYTGADKNRSIKRRAKEKIDQLTAPIEDGKPLSYRGETLQKAVEPRVLFFLNNSFPHTHSGYTVRTQNLLTALQRNGVKIHTATRLGYPLVVGKFPRSQIETVGQLQYQRLIPSVYPQTLQAREQETISRLLQIAKDFKPTVLHTTTDYNNALAVSKVAQTLDIPWIYEVRGEPESTWLSRFPLDQRSSAEKSDFYRLAHAQETRAMKAASSLICLSDVSKNALVKRGVDPQKIVVLPNAVDDSLLNIKYDQQTIRQELGLPDSLLIGTITSVVGYEGLDDLLRATALLPRATCLIVGDGMARPDLERLAAELNLKNRVIFAGEQPSRSIWKWYAALDVFVLPRKDSKVTRVVTPIKPLIAQALGKPVVASDLPAIREVTGSVGCFVKPESPDQLASAISKLGKSPQKRRTDIPTWNDNATTLINNVYSR